MAEVLTVPRINKAKPGRDTAGNPVRTEIADARQTGLYLVVQPSGKKSWAVRYRVAGVSKKHTLGPYPGIDLAKARKVAGNALMAVAEGRDPSQDKRVAVESAKRAQDEAKRAQRDLFENVAREFVQRYLKPKVRKKNKPDNWKETARILGLRQSPDSREELVEVGGDVIPAWRGRQIQTIAKRDIIDLLNGIADRAPIMANRTLAAVRKLFNWALANDIVAASPCAGIERPAPEQDRDRVLEDHELRLVWQAADAEGWPFGPIVKLLILTGQRLNEVAGLRWGEIDLDARLWTLRPERVKNNEHHEVPLSEAAIEIIQALPRIGGDNSYLFSRDGERPVTAFSRAKDRIDRTAPLAQRWTFHDLRRTMTSGMARLQIALPVIEKVLNHKSGTFRGVVRVYQRHNFSDEKRHALERWGTHVADLVSDRRSQDVVRPEARA